MIEVGCTMYIVFTKHGELVPTPVLLQKLTKEGDPVIVGLYLNTPIESSWDELYDDYDLCLKECENND